VCSIAGASYDSFSCACRPGMTGSNCEISACDSITCQNGGTCLLDVFGNPFCKCSPGYKGNRCQKDLCIPSPCQNGGSGCVHNPYGYGCTSCPFPNAGFLCEAHNIFALVGNPLALYSFSTSNKLLDETGNGYDLSPFNAESVNYPHIKSDDPYGNDPMNEALILFGQDIISTASIDHPWKFFLSYCCFLNFKVLFTNRLGYFHTKWSFCYKFYESQYFVWFFFFSPHSNSFFEKRLFF